MRGHVRALEHLRKAPKRADDALNNLKRRLRALLEVVRYARVRWVVWVARHAAAVHAATIHAAPTSIHAAAAAIHATDAAAVHARAVHAARAAEARVRRPVRRHAAVGRRVGGCVCRGAAVGSCHSAAVRTRGGGAGRGVGGGGAVDDGAEGRGARWDRRRGGIVHCGGGACSAEGR